MTDRTEADFGVVVDAFLAATNAATVHAVLALDEAHGHLVNARAVAAPQPSDRWYRLLDQFASKATVPESASTGPLGEIGERTDRFARDLLITAAAFLAAEANDLEDRIELLAGDRRQEGIRALLGDIADKAGDAADALLGRVENGTWQEFLESEPSELSEARPHTRKRSVDLPWPLPPPHRRPSRDRPPLLSRTAWSAAARVGVGLIAAGALVFAGQSLRQNTGTIQVLALGVVLLVSLGLLLGVTWTIQALQPKLRRQAEERRRLNEEWSAVRTARQQRGKCPRCASLLTERDWYFVPTLARDPTDDD